MVWISLPHGGPGSGFDVQALVDHIARSGREYIIQGQRTCTLADHRKPHSLDVWIRNHWTIKKDTKQADNDVVKQLVSTRLFERAEFMCPDSHRRCRGLKLTALAQG